MSHEYELTILVKGVRPEDDDQVYDEIARYWNAARCYRRTKVISVSGIDRMAGLGTPVTLRRFLQPHLSNLLGYPVEVAIKGVDREGINRGSQFWLHPDNDGPQIDPHDIATWHGGDLTGYHYSEDPRWNESVETA